MNHPFRAADILLPKNNFEKWSVIACDQFTSEPHYWEEVSNTVEDAPSALHIILPEIFLKEDNTEIIQCINAKMKEYESNGVFQELKNAMIYVERTQPDGRIRRGIVGCVDLEAYDYQKGATSQIRATEATVVERIPPRIAIRENAELESPHIMLLFDDPEYRVISAINPKNAKLLYDFDLMLDGGHITGYLLPQKTIDDVCNVLSSLEGYKKGMLFAVGDGNHSLATAKECYNKVKNDTPDSPARFALCEIVNIHDTALDFEPIYRVLFDVSPETVLTELKKAFPQDHGKKVEYITKDETGFFYLPENVLPVASLQDFIDSYLQKYSGKVDYIHGKDSVSSLASQENAIGFLFDGMEKSDLFPSILSSGSLPRKTFSMGHAKDKRYYLECRKIR